MIAETPRAVTRLLMGIDLRETGSYMLVILRKVHINKLIS
jgi:hypothetical protein